MLVILISKVSPCREVFYSNLVALICNFSRSLINPILYGIHTELAYSSCDLTTALYNKTKDSWTMCECNFGQVVHTHCPAPLVLQPYGAI